MFFKSTDVARQLSLRRTRCYMFVQVAFTLRLSFFLPLMFRAELLLTSLDAATKFFRKGETIHSNGSPVEQASFNNQRPGFAIVVSG